MFVLLNPTEQELNAQLPSDMHESSLVTLISSDGVQLGTNVKLPPFGYAVILN